MTTDLEHLLPAALDRLGNRAGHADGLAQEVRHAARRRRLLLAAPIAAVLAVCAVVAVVWTTAAGSAPAPVTGGIDSTPISACHPLQTGPLPTWARDGFSGDGAGVPWTLSASGNVAAIVFGYPLTAPAAADHNNKILWVVDGDVPVVIPSGTAGTAGGSAQPSQDLVITGRLEGTDVTTTIDTGAAPGPSIVDLPQPGCWHLEMAWGGRTDSIDLQWAPAG